MLIWKQKYIEGVSEMSNEQLLEEYTNLLTNVDSDAVRSNNDEWMLKKVEPELISRLVKCGFLNAK